MNIRVSIFILLRIFILVFPGYLIPKGWCVLASFSSVHMDEENYENPYQFDPWRWEVKDNFSLFHFSFLDLMLYICPKFVSMHVY